MSNDYEDEIVLTPEESVAVVDLISDPPPPTEHLVAAFVRLLQRRRVDRDEGGR